MKIVTGLLVTFLCISTSFAQVPPGDSLSFSENDRLFTYSDVSFSDTIVSYDFSSYDAAVFTQQLSEQKKKRPITKFIAPTLCITYGVLARFNDTPVRRFDKHIAGQVDKHVSKHYGIDNELQLIPAILGYGLDFIPGIKSQHNFRDRTLIFATSYLFMGAVVGASKKTISVVRPRGWHDDSFPSGHTSIAFTGAHLLYKEYKHISPWIGLGGYAIATATGALRVVNKAHWVSDVVTGAGVGILSAEVGYMMLPVWHRLFGIEDTGRSMVIMPSVNATSVGLGMVYVF